MRYLLPLMIVYLCAGCNGSATTKKEKTSMSEKQTPDWVHSTNIYEVNLRQYTLEGTFNAFAEELARLKDIGVRTLWFMPITPISVKKMKGTMGSYYACSDYTAINPEFGTLDDFKNLVKEAHQMGFKVIIDWVANHTGWDHRWTTEHPGYYLRDSITLDFKIASGMDDIIELDYTNPELVQAMIEAMQFWVKECDIDGFRCDLASWVELPFWQKARPAVDALKPLFWLGEFDELESPGYGQVFDASYTWIWMHKTKDFYQQQLPLTVLDSLLQSYNAIGDGSMRAWFTSNHDENSWNGTEYEKYGDMAKALAVFSATWNGIPLIYSGQEIPLKTKRLEFFDKDPIPWTGKNELHDFYKTLLELHSSHLALRAGDSTVRTVKLETSDPAHVFAFLRQKGEREVLVVLNLSAEKDLHFEITDGALSGRFINVFSGAANDFTTEKSFEMQPWEFLVYQKQD
jgi:alpha-amylase